MAIATTFHSWSDHPHLEAQAKSIGSPCLKTIRDFHLARWGGISLTASSLFQLKFLSNGKPSAHQGCAVDLRWANPGPGRTVLETEILPFYIHNSEELHIQAIHDYVGCRVWRANRSHDIRGGWKTQEQGSHDGNMGNPSSQWIHLEVSKDGWGDTRSVQEMLTSALPPQPRRETMLTGLLTDLKSGHFGLYPLNRDKPRLIFGDVGDFVLYAQAVIFFKGGGAIERDSRFGSQTRTRVLDVQTFFGLELTAEIDVPTWGALDLIAGMKT